MLHALLPAAALLAHNSAAKAETKTESTPNVVVSQASDSGMPANASWNPIQDGSTYP